jgi:hypothetical protein
MAPNAKANIHHNTLNITKDLADLNGETQTALWTENCNGISIYNNTATWQSNVPTANEVILVHGINMENSFWCTVSENKTENMGSGLRLSGDCRFTKLYCNFMKKCWHGTNIDNALANTQVSDQGTTTESWNNKWEDIPGAVISDRVINSTQIPIKWYIDPNVANASAFSPLPCNTFQILVLNAAATIQNCITPNFASAELRYDEFGNTINDSTYDDPDSLYLDYLDNEAYLRAGNRDSCLLDITDTSDQAYIDYLAQLEASNYGALYNINLALVIRNDAEAAQKLSVFQDLNALEYYKRLVLDYYLLYIADTATPPHSAIESITNIAYMHPFYGGEATYWARAILHLNIIDLLPPLRKAHLHNQISLKYELKRVKIKIFPNPSSDILNIERLNGCNSKIEIVIYDAADRYIASYECMEINCSFSIIKYVNGFYKLKVFEDGHLIQTEKIVIIR